MATVIRVVTIISVLAVLGGCWFFMDPAAPPFDDRLAVTRTVEDIFGDLRDSGVTMNVVDNGSRYFLLVQGPGISGDERTVAFDAGLQVRMNRGDLWGVPTAFPDLNGDFVVGTTLFDRSTFGLLDPSPFTSPVDNYVMVPFLDPNQVPGDRRTFAVALGDYELVANSGLRFVVSYLPGWGDPETPPIPVYAIARDPASDPEAPLGNFHLDSAHHDRGSFRSAVVVYNQSVGGHFVVVFPAAFVYPSRPPDAYLVDLVDSFPGVAVVELPTSEDHSVFYTRRGIVVVTRDGDHEVYSMAGKLVAEYRPDDMGSYTFAYSPDGRWVFVLDRARRRLSRSGTWW